MRRGWLVVDFLASGQGAMALQYGRFMYADRRDDMVVLGLADLRFWVNQLAPHESGGVHTVQLPSAPATGC